MVVKEMNSPSTPNNMIVMKFSKNSFFFIESLQPNKVVSQQCKNNYFTDATRFRNYRPTKVNIPGIEDYGQEKVYGEKLLVELQNM